MQLSEVLTLDCTKSAVPCSSKKRALEIISEIAAEHSGQNATELFESMLSREKMGSTGIGNGIALPHGRLAGLEKITAIIVTSNPAIDFDALDEKPVDIFFALLVPEEQTEGHLQTLASVAGKLSDKETVKAIRRAATSDDILSALA